MKKIAIIAIIMTNVLLMGCTKVTTNSEVKMMQEIDNDYRNTMADIKKMQIVDSDNDIYADRICIDVADKYISEFQTVCKEVTFSDNLVMREPLYSIQLINSDGNIADIWIVDEYRTIKNGSGAFIFRDGEIDELLNEMEKEYSIGYNLLQRQPGNQYFSVLMKTKKAEFRKLDQTNMDVPIEYSLPQEMINNLKNSWEKIYISSTPVNDYRIVYTLCFFNSDGNGLRTLHIDDNNKIYTNHGYELTGDFITRWVNTVMSEALMQ